VRELQESVAGQYLSFKKKGFSVALSVMPCCTSSISCVIFDIDGTLTQTSKLIFASFNHVAARHLGRTFQPEEIVSLFGPPEEGALLKVFGPDHLDAIMQELLEFYAANHATMASLHDGIDGVLRFLREQEVRLAVFTGKGRYTTAITLDNLKIASYFDIVVTGNDVIHHKPHPEGILRILDRFSISPQEALMIGDSISDIKASHAAGVRIASVVWDTFDLARVQAANPDCLFRTVDEMMSWFRDLFADNKENNLTASA
jgi:pyrophosphatase PpaX